MTPMTKVALGLFGAWAVHDLEELLTMSRSSRAVLPRLPERLPVPEALRRDGVSPRHAGLSIAMMGALTAAAAAEGVRTQGRSALFRGGVLAFGLHGFGHLAMAGAARRYVTGLATAPTLVIPYWVWARRRLARADIPAADGRATAVALTVGPVLVGIHALTYRLLAPLTHPDRPGLAGRTRLGDGHVRGQAGVEIEVVEEEVVGGGRPRCRRA